MSVGFLFLEIREKLCAPPSSALYLSDPLVTFPTASGRQAHTGGHKGWTSRTMNYGDLIHYFGWDHCRIINSDKGMGGWGLWIWPYRDYLGLSESIMALMRATEVRSGAGCRSLRLQRLLYKSVAWWVKTHVNCFQCCRWNKGYSLWHRSYFTPRRTQRRGELLPFCFFKYLTAVGFTRLSRRGTERRITREPETKTI